MTQFNPFPYSVQGPSSGGGMLPQQAVPQAPIQASTTIVAHSREIDLRTISGDIDPPVATQFYLRDYLLLVPADCALERLRLSAGANGIGTAFAFELIQLLDDGTKEILIPSTQVRSLDLTPTDYTSVAEITTDVPVLLRVTARFQTVTVFATLEALYTSVPE